MSNDLIDFNKLTRKREYKQNPLSLRYPSRCLIIGKSGTGKTSALCNLLLQLKYKLYYDKLYIFARDIYEEKYELIREMFDKIEAELNAKLKKKFKGAEFEPYKILHMSDDLNELPEVDSLDPNIQKVFVFDDWVCDVKDPNHKKIEHYFIRGRKKNVFTFYISQSYFYTPKILRENANYVILFKLNNKFDIDAITREIVTNMTKAQFRAIYNKMRKDNPYGFVVIDVDTLDDDKQVRTTFAE